VRGGDMTSQLLAAWWAADREEIQGMAPAIVRGGRPASDRTLPCEHPDTAIVEAIRQGDRAVFDQLVVSYGVALVRLAFSIGGRMAEAEDAAQDVLLWVWTNRESWMPRAGIRAYLLRAVANRARDLKSGRDNRGRLERTYLTTDLTIVPPASFAADEIDAALWCAIDALSPRAREAIMLRYVEGLAFAEVGSVLGISEDAAKKVVRRALLALHRTMPDGA